MRASLVISTNQRTSYLLQTLPRIIEQDVAGLQVVIVNDGPADAGLYRFCLDAGFAYYWTRRTTHEWRGGFMGLNIGIQQAEGDVLILSCPELFHIDDCLEPLISLVENAPLVMAYPGDAKDGGQRHTPGNCLAAWAEIRALHAEFGFLLAMRREHVLAIGGFDEDFDGYDCDDTDFTERLETYGCNPRAIPRLRCIHLWHPRYDDPNVRTDYNRKLMIERRGSIERNVGREWGKLEPKDIKG